MDIEPIRAAFEPFLGAAAAALEPLELRDAYIRAWSQTPLASRPHCCSLFWTVLAPAIYGEIARYQRERSRRHRLVHDAEGAGLAERHLAAGEPLAAALWAAHDAWYRLGHEVYLQTLFDDRAAYALLEPLVEALTGISEPAKRLVRALRADHRDQVTVLHARRRWGVICKLSGVDTVNALHVLLGDRLARNRRWQGWLGAGRVAPEDAAVTRGTTRLYHRYLERAGCFDLFPWCSLVAGEDGPTWARPTSALLGWTDEIGPLPHLDKHKLLIVTDGQAAIRIFDERPRKITGLKGLKPEQVERWFTRIARADADGERRRVDVEYHFARMRRHIAFNNQLSSPSIADFAEELRCEAEALPAGPLRLQVEAKAGWAAHFFPDRHPHAERVLEAVIATARASADRSLAVVEAWQALALIYSTGARWAALEALVEQDAERMRTADPAATAFVHRMLALGLAESAPVRAARHAARFRADAAPLLGERHPQVVALTPDAPR